MRKALQGILLLGMSVFLGANQASAGPIPSPGVEFHMVVHVAGALIPKATVKVGINTPGGWQYVAAFEDPTWPGTYYAVVPATWWNYEFGAKNRVLITAERKVFDQYGKEIAFYSGFSAGSYTGSGPFYVDVLVRCYR